MKNIAPVLLFGLIVLASIAGCRDVDDSITVTRTDSTIVIRRDSTFIGTSSTATVRGRVVLTPRWSERAFVTHEGSTAHIEGTTFTTSTDVNGNFEFSKVPQGVYDITLSHSGYGTYRIQSVTIPGGGNQPYYLLEEKLWQIPRMIATLDSISVTSYGYLHLAGTISNQPNWKNSDDGIVMFFSHHPDVSSDPAHFEYFIQDLVDDVLVDDSGNVREYHTFTGELPNVYRYGAIPLWPMDSMYVRVYASPQYDGQIAWSQDHYYDKQYNRYVPPAVTAIGSKIFAFKL